MMAFEVEEVTLLRNRRYRYPTLKIWYALKKNTPMLPMAYKMMGNKSTQSAKKFTISFTGFTHIE